MRLVDDDTRESLGKLGAGVPLGSVAEFFLDWFPKALDDVSSQLAR